MLQELSFSEMNAVYGGDSKDVGTAVGSVAGAAACPYVGAIAGDLVAGPGGAYAGAQLGRSNVGQAICISVGGYVGGAIGSAIGGTESSQPNQSGSGTKKRSN
jgi:hypothetical protein